MVREDFSAAFALVIHNFLLSTLGR
jgi:hypothetical protein